MATVSTMPNGSRRVQFTLDKRYTLWLGPMPLKTAESIRIRVEQLVSSKQANVSIPPETAAWLRDLPLEFHQKLERCGLVAPRAIVTPAIVTLQSLTDRFLKARSVKKSTRDSYAQGIDSLHVAWGVDRDITTITPEDAMLWRRRQLDNGYARATVAKRTNTAKSIFQCAVTWGLLAKSPFDGMRPGSQVNRERSAYVSSETIHAILKQCPDLQWRAIIALCRFAALRCPSEIIGLTWADVNFEHGRLTIRSPKTEEHAGGDSRLVPLGPDLLPILIDLHAAAPAGELYVVPRLRSPQNLRTMFTRLITRAGFQPWPRLFHNLRASCETDWCDRYPTHVVARWCGHSPTVAMAHYLQARDLHFQSAASTQSATQQPAAAAGNEVNDLKQNPEELPEAAEGCETVPSHAKKEIGRYRTRTPQDSSGITTHQLTGDASCDVTTDASLARVIEAWPRLPEALRSAIVSIVSTTG